MSTHFRIQELANNLDIENLRNKSHMKISGCTVCWQLVTIKDLQCLCIGYLELLGFYTLIIQCSQLDIENHYENLPMLTT